MSTWHDIVRQAMARSARRQGQRAAREGAACADLVPLDRALEALAPLRYRAEGPSVVPIDRIVGTFNRHRDFDLRFTPRNRQARERQAAVAGLLDDGDLPPVTLLRIGRAYFVEDGHHRIAAAAAAGRSVVRARVAGASSPRVRERGACSRLGFALDPTPCGAGPGG